MKMLSKKKISGIALSKYLLFAAALTLPLLFTNCKGKKETEPIEVQTEEEAVIDVVEDTTATVEVPPTPEKVTPPAKKVTKPATKPSPQPETKPAPSGTQEAVKPEIPFDESGHVYETVETMPEFPGGQAALTKYLHRNLKYPAAAQEDGIEGSVVVQFVVYRDGSIVNPVVVKSASPTLDKEAIRVVSAMPNWKPGIQGGKIVRTKYTLPVTFKLE